MADRIRIGVIGAGRIGKRHARTVATLIPNAELAVLADVSDPAVRALAAELRLDRWTTNTDDVLGDPSIDAIVIASSTDSHAPLIQQAAAAGKHVFTEKPIALDLESTDAALAAVERAGILLQVGFQRRYDKGFRSAKERIASGEIGEVEIIHDAMRDPSPPPKAYVATCGGLYRDMVIHNFDNIRWLMGAEPVEVYAVATCAVDPMFAEFNDVDTSVVTVTFDNGRFAVIDNSRRSGFGYDVRTEVFGSKGALFIGYSRDTPVLKYDTAGVHSDHVHFFLERFDQAYVDELIDFAAAVADRRQPAITGADGRAAIALAYACEASVREHAPVKLARFAKGVSA